MALALAADAGLFGDDSSRGRFHGCVALGCVIRGETSHYDIVAEQSAQGLMQVALKRNIPIGNGILTVHSAGQAKKRILLHSFVATRLPTVPFPPAMGSFS